MKILQVQFKNRNGHTLRGIVTLPDTEGKVPFVVHLHGFAGSCSGYKSMYTHLSRALAAQGIGSARFDFYGNGESDGEFEDMSFDGLHAMRIAGYLCMGWNSPMWTAKSYSSPTRSMAATLPPPAHRSSAPRPDFAVPRRRMWIQLPSAPTALCRPARITPTWRVCATRWLKLRALAGLQLVVVDGVVDHSPDQHLHAGSAQITNTVDDEGHGVVDGEEEQDAEHDGGKASVYVVLLLAELVGQRLGDGKRTARRTARSAYRRQPEFLTLPKSPYTDRCSDW